MRKILTIFLIIFLIGNCLAGCSDDQIDINTASKEEIDILYGIGPVKADAIIDERPFDDVDELIEVSGIGEVTLEKIKEQGLACVRDEADNLKDENTREPREVGKIISTNKETGENYNIPQTLQPITLGAKDIKSEGDKKSLDKSDYALYGFVFFCILLAVLFFIRKRTYDKNEFA